MRRSDLHDILAAEENHRRRALEVIARRGAPRPIDGSALLPRITRGRLVLATSRSRHRGIATFATTFLGHQGWLVRSARVSLLIDPILCEEFGDAYALGYRIYPPRDLRLDAFPAIDALFLTHEHDDHFDIASLAKLDRRIPVFLSTHSSSAGFAILREMGFVVRPLVPGVPVAIGDLEMIAFCGDHLSVNSDDEWDALPFMVRHREGAGSFFTMVDIMMIPGHLEWARACAPRPGLVTWTNNTLDWSFMADYVPDAVVRDAGTEACTERMETGRQLLERHWGRPAAMLMCAGGFTFHGDRRWLNDRVFGIDTEAVCRTIGSHHPNERFVSTVPGQTFRMEANRLVAVWATGTTSAWLPDCRSSRTCSSAASCFAAFTRC